MIVTTTGERTPQTEPTPSQDQLLFGGPADDTPRFGMLGTYNMLTWVNTNPTLARFLGFAGGIATLVIIF